MAPDLYYRNFTRNGTDDEDHLADEDFLAANFVDHFGKWLQIGNNASVDNFNDLINVFWNQSKGKKPPVEVHMFMVADGSAATVGEVPKADWFDPHIRLVAIVHSTGDENNAFNLSTEEWTLCIVGSAFLSDSNAFLQVAAWDGLTFRYYQRDKINNTNTWNYFGNSMDAFGKNEYLGPFNGHVNGACVMKEIHEPWLHWFNNNSTINFTDCFTDENNKEFMAAPYLTQPGGSILSQLTEGPDVLEQMITDGISAWFLRRVKNDFFSASGLLPSPKNVPRWAAHLFLTTTINMAAAKMNSNDESFSIPLDHFYDNESLSSSLINLLSEAPRLNVSVTEEEYQTAVKTLGLCVMQRIDVVESEPKPPGYVELPLTAMGGDKRFDNPDDKVLAFRTILQDNEGQAQFNILQASYEDAQGVVKMQTLKKLGPNKWLGLFSTNTFNALMMLDFWNPIYSWRRGVMMQYVPQNTTWNGKTYDLDVQFIDNVNNSSYVKAQIVDSPEYQFIQLLKLDLNTHQQNIANYFKAIEGYLGGKETKAEALVSYLSLAESRRRIYRPLPLDEFDTSMPYALNIPYDSPFLEMTADAKIQPMPARGQDFLLEWTRNLAGVDPEVVQGPSPEPNGPLSIAALPRPSLLVLPCQGALRSSTTARRSTKAGRRSTKRGCPFIKNVQVSNVSSLISSAKSSTNPTWEYDVLPLFTKPYWIAEDKRDEKSAHWIEEMLAYSGLKLDDYDSVKSRVESIYRHLRSTTMPITSDPHDYWPEEALETLRAWANGGFPLNSSSVISPKMIIPKPLDPLPSYRVRRDIMSLTPEELSVYQSRLEDVLRVGELGSKWQELGRLHADWCLHYQEATFLWHRAFLTYVEELIDFPIPYWNGYAVDSTKYDSPHAGVPSVFFDDHYISPKDQSTRCNPLKYALSLNGKSKSPENRYVTRNSFLFEREKSPEWTKKIDLFKTYHKQITDALSQSSYTSSHTSEHFGVPWANIQNFKDDNPDSWYPYRMDFDGLFEQVHDNFHGFVGPDMADNTYTAFDPIFLSYHANMDRLAGIFMEAHPNSQFTSNFPLQPFIDNGTKVSYDDPRRWKYTTIGDMAKNTRALGYMYEPPVSPDAFTPPVALSGANASGGRAISLPVEQAKATDGWESGTAAPTKKKVPYVSAIQTSSGRSLELGWVPDQETLGGRAHADADSLKLQGY
ncbi:hypothetical protein G7Z17_g12337 [Cylindrodendrum hubeiense]|uniref:tyrosinase n=1 Tax=Cylindrodendrum hubeiense TaxID=595255 RepID=A0A9P5GXW2_9HYPO|nr:hypothetical protein G7Z17_g12337 [Cylindrodendrum hubeiense]